MEYMRTFHILNVYVDKTKPRQFKFTFKDLVIIIDVFNAIPHSYWSAEIGLIFSFDMNV